MPKLSVYMIALNEEDKIGPALKSVDWADEIIVADSYSTDRTALIAQEHGAKVVQIRFAGFGDLRNRAMAACSNEWILSLDADERCSENARKEIIKIIQSPDCMDAYYIPRRNHFMGKWIRQAGFYPDYRHPQLFRKGVLTFSKDAVHAEYTLQSDRSTGYLKSHICHIPYKNLDEILEKVNRYSTLGAKKMDDSGKKAGMFKALSHGLWSFFNMYLLNLGFLDGWAGFIIALGSFEGTFYKYAKCHLKQNRLESFFDFSSSGRELQ